MRNNFSSPTFLCDPGTILSFPRDSLVLLIQARTPLSYSSEETSSLISPCILSSKRMSPFKTEQAHCGRIPSACPCISPILPTYTFQAGNQQPAFGIAFLGYFYQGRKQKQPELKNSYCHLEKPNPLNAYSRYSGKKGGRERDRQGDFGPILRLAGLTPIPGLCP